MAEITSESTHPEYSARLRSLLDRNRETQAELAAALDVLPATVSLWIGKGSIPHRPTLERLCAHFGVRPEWLVKGFGPKGAKPAADPMDDVPAGLRDDLATLARAAQENPDAKAIITHAARLFRKTL